MPLRDVSLDDKYDLSQRHIFVTGFQALVRLCLMQKELDRRNGLNTAGFVTGYRGSPLGNLDSQFLRAKRFLQTSDVRFQGGINEDLAATAVWGSQQAALRGEGKYDGVFAMWYGKGPGVDRTGDVFRHANLAGSARHGGVLALMGDDHTAESSTTAHQSEYHFIDVMIPVLNPAGVQEVLDYGLYGWAMSRYTGAWTALKTMHETIESTAAIDASLERINIVVPDDFRPPDGGLNIRLHDQILAQEAPCTTTSATRCSLSCAPTNLIATSPPAAAILKSASSLPAKAISTFGRLLTNSVSTKSNAMSSASACIRWRACGRSAGAN
jgi:indolepyruvate ferredoxin oxidoreductase